MKKLLALTLALLMTAALLPLNLKTAVAEDETSGQCGDDLYWEFDESTGTLTITGSGAMYDYGIGTAPWNSVRSEITAVVFPDGMTSVGRSAFYGCTGIEEIVVPDSVTVINDGAFRGCTGVTSITAPCSVRVVSTNYTFSDCTAVTTVHITKGTGTMTTGPLPYVSGSGSVSVILDDGVRNISDKAFRNKRYLTSITIPSSVTDIADEAFYGCSGLTAITIPSSVTDIGDSAFYNCTGLEAIAIPDSVTSIGWGAFFGCTGLASVAIPSSVTCIADHMFYGCTGLPSVTIPSGVTSIGKSAFEGCTGLKSVTIPSGVTNIEDGAFKECTGLPSIVIPDSVTSVGAQAFYGCSALKNVTMPCSAEIVLSAFDDSEAIKKLRFTVGTGEWKISNKMSSPLFQGKNMTAVLDEGIPEIGEYGFYRCSGLTSITIPSSVTSIGDRAFYACTGLPEITILSYVTSIGKEAFRGCTGLRSASIDSGVIGESAFQECTGIESLAIGDAAESIGASAFYGCTQLTSVEIGGGVTGIGNSAFNNCRALTTITIPDKVTSIGEFAFYGCVQLTSATIGDGVTDVGKNAFKECAGLASITMPCSANIGQSAFSGCKAVTEVHLTKGTGTMTGYKPNTYEYTPWYVSRGNAMTVTLDEGILNIGSWAFYNCTGLTEITLPSSLVSIDAYAFNDCKGLTEIFISDNVTNIGAFAFSGCTYLTDVYYDGTPQMRRKITIQHSNTNLLDAEWHYLPLNAIEWKTLPKKLTYVTGEPLSVYGGAITTYYDHDVVEEEPLTADMVTGFDSSVLGKQTLTVMFGGKTLTYEIEVIAQIQIEGTVEWNAEDVQFKGTTPYVIANGSAQTPRFTVKNSADGSVIDPECYDFEYKENTDAGTGYVIVTFKGDYEGTCRGFFKIYLPATTKTWVENVSDGIKVGWEPVEGAAGYVIYRRAWSTTTNGWTEFKRWNNTTETTYIDGKDEAHKVYAGTRYQYGVKAYFARRTDPVSGALIGGNVGDNYNLGEVGPLKTTVRITTRKLVQVRPGKKEMTVKWEKSKNFTGYQIQIATDSAFKQNTRVIKIDNWETYWTTVRDLNSNTTYYVRIRSYQEFEGMTYFGEWSNVISCKTN
ncbi:MAG: leucine-rich repeat protein [Clostridia bacterium]|nr:leucine-rich repeat protein [Clostridia bacterium]